MIMRLNTSVYCLSGLGLSQFLNIPVKWTISDDHSVTDQHYWSCLYFSVIRRFSSLNNQSWWPGGFKGYSIAYPPPTGRCSFKSSFDQNSVTVLFVYLPHALPWMGSGHNVPHAWYAAYEHGYWSHACNLVKLSHKLTWSGLRIEKMAKNTRNILYFVYRKLYNSDKEMKWTQMASKSYLITNALTFSNCKISKEYQ